MCPLIYKEGESFSFKKLEEICVNHLADGRGKLFAFIIPNIINNELIESLRTEDFMRSLDVISGKKLSIFYFNTEGLDILSGSVNESWKRELKLKLGLNDEQYNFFSKLYESMSHKQLTSKIKENSDLILFSASIRNNINFKINNEKELKDLVVKICNIIDESNSTGGHILNEIEKKLIELPEKKEFLKKECL